MNFDEIQAYVERSTIEGQFQMDRFTNLLGAVEVFRVVQKRGVHIEHRCDARMMVYMYAARIRVTESR